MIAEMAILCQGQKLYAYILVLYFVEDTLINIIQKELLQTAHYFGSCGLLKLYEHIFENMTFY